MMTEPGGRAGAGMEDGWKHQPACGARVHTHRTETDHACWCMDRGICWICIRIRASIPGPPPGPVCRLRPSCQFCRLQLYLCFPDRSTSWETVTSPRSRISACASSRIGRTEETTGEASSSPVSVTRKGPSPPWISVALPLSKSPPVPAHKDKKKKKEFKLSVNLQIVLLPVGGVSLVYIQEIPCRKCRRPCAILPISAWKFPLSQRRV